MKKGNRRKYFITMLTAVIFTAVICMIRGIFLAQDFQTVMRHISDAFFIVGVVYAGIGLLIYALNEGIFNAMAFGLKTLAHTFTAHRKGAKIREENFYEYNKRMQEKKRSFQHLVVVVAGAIIISVIFVLIYMFL